MTTTISVKQAGLTMGSGDQQESVAAEKDGQNRGMERLPEGRASTGENLESTALPRDSSAKGIKTNLAGEKKGMAKTLHEFGNGFREDKKSESIIPSRGKDSLEDTTTQKVLSEEMHWESAGVQSQIPHFVFDGSPEACGVLYEADNVRPRTNEGPMALSYSNEVGWTAEVLGPKSGHWKRKARASQGVGPKENISPNVLVKAEGSLSKRESSIPLQELDQNLLELKKIKKGKSSITQGAKGSTRDGGEAATATQCRRAQ